MISRCPDCGADLDGPVVAIEHYQRTGRNPSACDRRQRSNAARRAARANVVDLGDRRQDRVASRDFGRYWTTQ